MKRERKFRLLAFILPVLMLIQAFFLAPTGLAEEKAKKVTYTVHLDFSIKDTTVKESSRRQVKLWKIPQDKLKKDQAGEVDRLSMAKKYDGMKEEDIIKDLGEEIRTSEESEIKDDNNERISIQIEQEENEESYYLIKESEESFAKMKDRIDSGKSSKLTTTVLKVPNDEFKNNKLLINLKDSPKTKDLKLIKVDADNPNIKLDKVGFKLFKKVVKKENKDDDSQVENKDIPIDVDGSLGKYKFKGELTDEKLAKVLETNSDGEILVSGLDENSSYYFKEVKPIKGYKNVENEGVKTEDKNPGEVIEFKNKRIPFVKKQDSISKKALTGVVFEVYNSKDEKLSFTWDDKKDSYIYDETSENTRVETKGEGQINILDMPSGTGYYFKEVEPLENYEPLEEKITFDVDENGQILNSENNNSPIVVYNTPKDKPTPPPTEEKPKGGRKFVKVDWKDHSKKLKGAKFNVEVLNEDIEWQQVERDGKLYIVESDENGVISVDNLDYGEYRLTETTAPTNYTPLLGFVDFKIDEKSANETATVIENKYNPPKEETPPPTPPETPDNPTTITPSTPTKTLTSRSRGPLVKTGDIRIWIYFAIGLIMIVAGFIIIRNQDKKQELA